VEPNEEPLIAIRGLVKRYGDKTVLDGIDLQVERGETLCVIGGSGSGKSTLVRLVVGLERPTAGHVYVEGRDMTTPNEDVRMEIRKRFAFVFQNHALLDSMTVYDNVAFPLREETDLEEDEIQRRALAILRELGVEQAAGKLPAELSGGMAKRVAIARAMVTEPEILIYDEPTSGLDPVTSRTVDALIERLRAEHLVTSIVITHDMVTAYTVADRVALLAHGKLVAVGEPTEIFASHNDQITPFASSSGIDLERLDSRRTHVPASEIRARWRAQRVVSEGPRAPR
jgi:phospholipid/cholesterol/gamma-HCH transport system ATP-binding protein